MRSSSHTCMYLLDMSVGANIVLSSIIACNASVKFGYAGLIIAPLICGTIIGLINGIVYIKLHISSLIVTCALSLIYEALSVYTTNGKNVILSTEYRAFGDYPVNLILALIAYFLCAFILKYTKIGIYTYAIGSNEVVAKNMGVNVSKYKIVAFTLAEFFFGLAFKKYGHPVVAIVIGENGSGKSTLTSCLTGIYQKDSGKFILEGKEITATNQVEANHQGVAIIVQEIGTFSGLTVAENIFLGNEDKFTKHGIKNTAAMNKQAQEYLDSYGFNYIDATKVIDDYNFEDRKLVEIVKATYFNPKVLVVDEATTALGQKGREELFKVMHKVRDTGNCVIFISHDIEEVIEQADNISVLRDGVKIGSITKAEATPDKLKALMVGREIGDNYYRTDYGEEISKEIVLSAKNVTVKGQIEDLNLELHKGEILGIGGLSECGMHEVGKALFGASYFRQGTVTLGDGTPINSIPDAIKHSIAYASKDRDNESLVINDTIGNNICLPSLENLKTHGMLRGKSMKEFANKYAKQMSTKMTGVDQFVSALSGGNKQKVVLARWVGKDSDLIILDSPTRGIDVKVKADIYAMMNDMRKSGKSIIMISEEIMELLGMADRILIMKDGKINGEFLRSPELKDTDLIDNMI
ncbi:ATP-binding cassette domain-containing protein [Blautia obeum]|jgi:ABC-type sugar transport system ATPase subunit|uniref:ATP-binding cassette domain-containing protein n=1 Tax=Blautia obeum TaxID=40520 RepID=A0A454HG59_9FIRM|nr:ATP-binding cassette domain-containing protein [Blautia obeum]RGY05661.1 ATP-binding cassette domain-containing protein [Blautia obeum]RHC05681.1 ATP-binding cassette domain-containing protein [Blautia obeum]RHC84402.1 ATP-binding cassette domain-containing protein [Blautia obeum]RHL47404.1 ATP-binding cassette domain-containing protein [Blautia obeum]